MHYTPDVAAAFAAIQHIDRDVISGALLHDLHANGGSLFFVAVYAHIFRGLYYGSYKAPREITWIIGILIYLAMMATAFMGYVLPWGQMSFWGATVITNLFSAIPLIGDPIVEWLWGGFAVGNPTLQRFFSLHYLLPFVIAALVAVHIWAFHTTGNGNPTGVEVRRDSMEVARKDTVPFWPYYVVKDLFALSFILVIFAAFVWFMPDYLGHPDNYTEANPLVTPAHIVPEWYFLPFYAILRAITFDILFIDSKLGGVIAMFGSIVVLALVPWLDTSRVRSGRYRPRFKWWFWLLVLDFAVLTWCGGQPPEGLVPTISLLGTMYWFAYFLVILPVLGLMEKPLPQPETIEADFDAHYPPKSAVTPAE
jgi:ubiquinol-cytochrome c reductase cytochrome b subunit